MGDTDLLLDARVASRIWERERSLWPGDPDKHLLGWLDLPEQLPQLLSRLEPLAEDLRRDGLTEAIVLGMGGSSLTAATLTNILEPGQARLRVLDTIHPDALRDPELAQRAQNAAFLVGSKSGTTAETLMLEAHFRHVLSSSMDSAAAAKRMIALADAGTPLAQRGASPNLFRCHVETPADVGGRYSAFSAFGMLPALLGGADPRGMLPHMQEMARRCGKDCAENPALQLGAKLGNNARNSKDKVTLITSPRLQPFAIWAEQLMAESTGKEGVGLVPIVGEDLRSIGTENCGARRNFFYLRLKDDRNTEADELWKELQERGEVTTLIEMDEVAQIGAEMFKWEISVAAAAYIMGINAFDQPNVESAKARAGAMLDSVPLHPLLPDFSDLAALTDALPGIAAANGSNYIAILAYLPPSDALDNAVQQLRTRISRATGLPTLFGYGPRYLHSTGQLLKGGRRDMMAVGIWNAFEDLPPPPGQTHSPGQFMMAQAHGDFAVMRDNLRPVATLELGRNPAAEIAAFAG